MRLILIAIFSAIISQAATTTYNVTSSRFGLVGTSVLKTTIDDDKYTSTLTSTLKGTAATFTNDRVETYISRGTIVNSEYIPDKFTKLTEQSDKKICKTFVFNHSDKTITTNEHSVRTLDESTFDPIKFMIVSRSYEEILTVRVSNHI